MWFDKKDAICCVTSFNAYFIFFLTLKLKTIFELDPDRFSNTTNLFSHKIDQGEKLLDADLEKVFVKFFPLFPNTGIFFPQLLHPYYGVVFYTTPLKMGHVGKPGPVFPDIT